MYNLKFISYSLTPGEKHNGIAAISLDDKIMLRYKVMPTKDGSSFYPVPASYKIDEGYVPAFTIDSNIQKEEIEKLIKTCVKKYLSTPHVTQKMKSNVPDDEEVPF